ncbi:MAG: sulfatase [Opitutae bacterium]|nr:sulfatase [Opitutae bacterium]
MPFKISYLLTIISGTWMTFGLCSASERDVPRPNILWITAEDMSPALGCYGDKYATTPHIDRLATQSVRYLNAFATAPVCSPARSCLITGVHAVSLGTQHLRSNSPLPDFIHGFPHYLRKVGYYTTNNGKTDYNTSSEKRLIRESWSESSPKAHWRGRKDSKKPFFSIFNLMVSHQSRSMVYPYERFQKEVQSKLTADQIHDPANAPLPPYYPDTPITRRTVARFYDCVTLMDKQVGDILAQLEEDGLADDTIVFFYSDHGSGIPRHKRVALDSGLHVPLLIRFPEKYKAMAPSKAGATTDRLVSFVDFAPTALNLLGLPIPEYMQGKPFLGSKSSDVRRYLHAARDRVDEAYDFARATRDKRWLYVRTFRPDLSFNQPTYYSDMGEVRHEFYKLAELSKMSAAQRDYAGPVRPLEALYDCLADPMNLKNLAAERKYLKELNRLRNAQGQWIREVRDLGFLPEELVKEMSLESSPYEATRQEKEFPPEELIDALQLIGIDEERRDELLGLLGSDDPALRYWGLIGLGEHDHICETCYDDLKYVLRDKVACNRIEAAALLHENDQKEGLPVLLKELHGDDPDLVLRTSRALELLGAKAKPAIPAMNKALGKWRKKRAEGPLGLFIEFSLEAALVRLGADPGTRSLSY